MTFRKGQGSRAAALTDIALTDNLPRDPLSCFDRQHRWIRGDVQSLALLGKYVENSDGELYPNPINSLSKFKIADNVRRALVPVSAFIALLLCIFLPYRYSVWGTAAALSYLIFPFVLSVLTLMKSSGRRFFPMSCREFSGRREVFCTEYLPCFTMRLHPPTR